MSAEISIAISKQIQKFAKLTLGIIKSASATIAALTTKLNKPRVNMVNGIDISCAIGLIKILTSHIIKPATKYVATPPSTVTNSGKIDFTMKIEPEQTSNFKADFIFSQVAFLNN